MKFVSKLSKLLAAGALATTVFVGSASGASAAIMVATYSGTVRDGVDATGEFGVSGLDLTGAAFIATYTYDTARGYHESSSVHEQVLGGSDPGFAGLPGGSTNPILNASIKVNGKTQTFLPDRQGVALTFSGYAGHTQGTAWHFDEYSDGFHYQSNNLYFEFYSPLLPASLTEPFSGGPSGSYGPFSYGFLNLQGATCDHSAPASCYATFKLTRSVQLRLRTDHLTVSSGATAGGGVPEPASWAMMLVGFFGLGATLRRARGGPLIA